MARTDPIAHLSRHPDELPRKLVHEILALGPAGIARLLEIARDPASREPTSIGHVQATNAVQVLGVARVPEAVPVLIELQTGAELGSPLYRTAMIALGFLAGPELVEPMLAEPTDGVRRAEATYVLARCGVRDPRIRARIEELFDLDPEGAAIAAQRYGDRDLVPAIRQAFDRIDRTRAISREEAARAHRLTRVMRALGVPDEAREKVARETTLRAIEALHAENVALEEENRRLEHLADSLDALGSRRSAPGARDRDG